MVIASRENPLETEVTQQKPGGRNRLDLGLATTEILNETIYAFFQWPEASAVRRPKGKKNEDR